MCYKKKYRDALKTAEAYYKQNRELNPELKCLLVIFPELRESEDERIRKRIRLCLDEGVHSDIIRDYERDECLAYLERQKEQQPAEWSEEDEAAFGDLMWCIEQARKSAKDENDMGNVWFAENWVKNRIKSLRPQPHWKPSEEQMEALERCVDYLDESDNEDAAIIGSLCHDLKLL